MVADPDGSFHHRSRRPGRLPRRANSRDEDIRLSTYRTEHGAEVDLILERKGEIHAIEMKGSKNIGSADLRGLQSFSHYHGRKHHAWIFYLGDHKKRMEGVEVLPWQEGMKALGL